MPPYSQQPVEEILADDQREVTLEERGRRAVMNPITSSLRRMKLHFEPNLDYQLQAIEAVCDLFRGQEICRTEFTVVRNAADAQVGLGFAESELGTGNRLSLPDEEIFSNLKGRQQPL